VTRLRWFEPVFVGTILVAPSFVWIGLDRSVWPWDPSWYGEVSLDLYSALRLHTNWIESMLAAFGQKAPGIAWLGQFFVPLGGVVGSDGRGLLISIVLVQAATVAFVYAAARTAAPQARFASASSALLLAGAPLFVGLSHAYFAEPLQAFTVAWVVYVMSAAATWRPALTLAQLTAALAVGMLAKVSTPAYAGLPAVTALALSVWASRHAEKQPAWYRDRAVLLSGALAVIPLIGAIAWYNRNGRTAVHHAAFAAGSELYGGGGSYSTKLSRWLHHLDDATFNSRFDLLILFIAAGAVVTLLLKQRGATPINAVLLVQAGACLTTICALMLLFAHASNEDVRFLLAGLPLVCFLLAVFLGAVDERFAIAAAVLLAIQFVNVNGHALGVRSASHYPYLAPPVRDSTLAHRLRGLVDATCNDEASGRINVVGGDYPWLNGNTMSMLADERHTIVGPECEYTPLGYAATDAVAAWKRVLSLSAPYYLSIDYGDRANTLPPTLAVQVPTYAAFNKVNRAVFRRALDSGSYVAIPSTRAGGFVVLHRRARAPAAHYDARS
jgi:Dolichyl-phosphate-mannose-protein mannosyltransferase